MISYIGYASLTIKDVLVRADLTSDLNIQIKVEAIEGAEVEVIADRLMVQKDITFTRKLVTEEDFANIPGFESSGDVFRMQAGAITDVQPIRLDMVMGSNFRLEMKALKMYMSVVVGEEKFYIWLMVCLSRIHCMVVEVF